MANTHHRYRALNRIAQFMGMEQEMVMLSAYDIMGLVNQLRYYQRTIASLQPSLDWVDESIERIKYATGKGFGDC